MKPQTFVFDAYGTLFDVHSAILRSDSGISGDLPALSLLWRQRQLEYTWLWSLMERYRNFWSVTEVALRSAAAQLHITPSESQLDSLMQAYLSLEPFPDAQSVLEVLSGKTCAILSNGSTEMLNSVVRHNGFDSFFSKNQNLIILT